MEKTQRETKVAAKHFTARMPEDLLVEIKVRAAREKTTIQDVILRACRQYLRTPLKRSEEK